MWTNGRGIGAEKIAKNIQNPTLLHLINGSIVQGYPGTLIGWLCNRP